MPHMPPHDKLFPTKPDIQQPSGPVTSTTKITFYIIGGVLLILFIVWISSL